MISKSIDLFRDALVLKIFSWFKKIVNIFRKFTKSFKDSLNSQADKIFILLLLCKNRLCSQNSKDFFKKIELLFGIVKNEFRRFCLDFVQVEDATSKKKNL